MLMRAMVVAALGSLGSKEGSVVRIEDGGETVAEMTKTYYLKHPHTAEDGGAILSHNNTKHLQVPTKTHLLKVFQAGSGDCKGSVVYSASFWRQAVQLVERVKTPPIMMFANNGSYELFVEGPFKAVIMTLPQ